MNSEHSPYWNHEKLFQLFKYTIYGLIFVNLIIFMFQDYYASEHTFKDGVDLANIGNAFSAFVDSVAWFILLIIFELETYALEDDQLSSKRKLVLNIFAAICYVFIFIAFWGYVEKSYMIYAFTATPITDLCAIVSSDLSLALALDEYVPLTVENCGNVIGQLYFQNDTLMYADAAKFDELKKIVLIDVVNAGTWLVVVAVLQIEVLLQLRGELTSYLYKLNSFIKIVSYFILLLCCLYWGYMGDGIGFWDAILWLLAFIFIELNIFQWRQEGDDDEAVIP